LVDGRGVPLSIANRHDVSQLAAVLDGIVVQRPDPPERRSKHLCADAGYTGDPARCIIDCTENEWTPDRTAADSWSASRSSGLNWTRSARESSPPVQIPSTKPVTWLWK